ESQWTLRSARLRESESGGSESSQIQRRGRAAFFPGDDERPVNVSGVRNRGAQRSDMLRPAVQPRFQRPRAGPNHRAGTDAVVVKRPPLGTSTSSGPSEPEALSRIA